MSRGLGVRSARVALVCAALSGGCTQHGAPALAVLPLPNPAPPGSVAPNETATVDGGILLSWLEPAKERMTLRFASRLAGGWAAPRTVVSRTNFDRFAGAPPWVLALPDHSLLAVWSEQLPKGKSQWAGNYLYSSTSSDDGKTWSEPAVVHSDRTDGEHSFASIAVLDDDHATIVWLDARDYETKGTYRLMSAVIAASGAVSDEQTLDDDVCTCCPTSMVRTPKGLLVAYRNRTKEEIRDIYTVRQESGQWQAGRSLADDGWRINACPVNGPAVARREGQVAIAWYSGVEGKASLQVGFSDDGGQTFPKVRTLDAASDGSQPVGRPALAFLEQGEVLVAWITRVGGESRLVAARVRPGDAGVQRVEVARGAAESLGYPRMQLLGSQALLSWAGSGAAAQVDTAGLRWREP